MRLLQTVGVERARQLLMDFGLQDNQIPRNFTIALGTPQVLPIQMATGYATFANGGYRIQPHFIRRIEDAYGNVIFEAKPEYACIPCINEQPAATDTAPQTPDDEVIEVNNQTLQQPPAPAVTASEDTANYRQAQRILKSSSAYDMANILRDVILHGTGRAALKIGRDDLGGKTGTTNDAKDAWFAGFNGKLVAVAWVGFDQPTTLGRREYGGIAALPIWTNFMDQSLKNTPSAWVRLDKMPKRQFHAKNQPLKLIIAMTIKPHHRWHVRYMCLRLWHLLQHLTVILPIYRVKRFRFHRRIPRHRHPRKAMRPNAAMR